MTNYVLLYTGGTTPEAEEDQAEVMAAWAPGMERWAKPWSMAAILSTMPSILLPMVSAMVLSVHPGQPDTPSLPQIPWIRQ